MSPGRFFFTVALGIVAEVTVLFLDPEARGDPIVDLGAADPFSVLAASGITVAGAVDSTAITGDLGSFPTASITGLGNVVLNGTNQAGDAVTQSAQLALLSAYNVAAGLSATTSFGPITDLGGLTLAPGVYADPSSFGITGTLVLNAAGNPNAIWVFQAGSTLITAGSSNIVLENGAQACNIFWVVGSSATIGPGSDFVGAILADASITADIGAEINGQLLALNGAVTLDGYDTITLPAGAGDCVDMSVPDAGGTLGLLGIGLAALLTGRFCLELHWKVRRVAILPEFTPYLG